MSRIFQLELLVWCRLKMCWFPRQWFWAIQFPEWLFNMYMLYLIVTTVQHVHDMLDHRHCSTYICYAWSSPLFNMYMLCLIITTVQHVYAMLDHHHCSTCICYAWSSPLFNMYMLCLIITTVFPEFINSGKVRLKCSLLTCVRYCTANSFDGHFEQ